MARSGVMVIEPTLMSHLPFQLPAVITSQDGVSHCTSTPIRLAISSATLMSKPLYSPWLFWKDCGG